MNNLDIADVVVLVVSAIVGFFVPPLINIGDYCVILELVVGFGIGVIAVLLIHKRLVSTSDILSTHDKCLTNLESVLERCAVDCYEEIELKGFKRELTLSTEGDNVRVVGKTTRIIENVSAEPFSNFVFHIHYSGNHEFSNQVKILLDNQEMRDYQIVKTTFERNAKTGELSTACKISIPVEIGVNKTRTLVVIQDISNSFNLLQGAEEFIGIKPEYRTDSIEIVIKNETSYRLIVPPNPLRVCDHRNEHVHLYQDSIHKEVTSDSNSYRVTVYNPHKDFSFRVYFRLDTD